MFTLVKPVSKQIVLSIEVHSCNSLSNHVQFSNDLQKSGENNHIKDKELTVNAVARLGWLIG